MLAGGTFLESGTALSQMSTISPLGSSAHFLGNYFAVEQDCILFSSTTAGPQYSLLQELPVGSLALGWAWLGLAGLCWAVGKQQQAALCQIRVGDPPPPPAPAPLPGEQTGHRLLEAYYSLHPHSQVWHASGGLPGRMPGLSGRALFIFYTIKHGLK